MVISKHAEVFAGLPVHAYDPEARTKKSRKPCVYRVGGHGGDEEVNFPELLDRFLTDHGGKDLKALVIGPWDYEDMAEALSGRGAIDVVEALVANRKRMPNLRSLFFGDITFTECEMSWIGPGDLSALLPAFPRLEEFRVRGTVGLTLGKIKHNKLRSLAVESGGLPNNLLKEVWKAQLPKLEHLELWLGSEDYGGIADTKPLRPLLSGDLFKKLKYLGLRNSEMADAVAKAVADSPILERLQVLDLSWGNLTDVRGEALLKCPAVRKLKKLDLHHHFLSKPFVKQFEKLPIEVDVSEAQEPDFYTYGESTGVSRYNVVSE